MKIGDESMSKAMSMKKKTVAKLAACVLTIAMVAALTAGCGGSKDDSASSDSASEAEQGVDVTNPENVSDLKLDNTKWQYDVDNDVYYQIGIVYCTDPAEEDYEKLAIYVPGKYMSAKKNDDGTYTCEVSKDGKVGDYTAETAPLVMPVNTAGYSAQKAQTEYSYQGAEDYLKEGYIYVHAGCRGREHGAPYGVTDLKAAIRYLRYNDDSIAGDTEKVFSFGHSGGGAQSAILGASGDSELYYQYLEAIGSVMLDDNDKYISDATYGAMCWCPITSLDVANEAYEWMMGQFADSGTRAEGMFTSALSEDLAKSFADYINEAKFTADGKTLTLEESKSGTYLSGSYYDYVMETIETSLNNFLKDTEFPYTNSSSENAGMNMGGSGERPSGEAPSGEAPDGNGPSGGGGMPGGGSSGSTDGETYETAKDYIDALNEDGEWVEYDEEKNTAKIKSLSAFVKHCKQATKDVGAFDALDRSQAENAVFGQDGDGWHFDSTMAKLLADNAEDYSKLTDYESSYADDYASDIKKEDPLGVSSQTRQNMYNPMYYLSDYYDGMESSTPAKYWRINTGIEQGDTSLTTELNLALALEANTDVKSVDFTTVWGQGHTEAERTGNATDNFINWINTCMR